MRSPDPYRDHGRRLRGRTPGTARASGPRPQSRYEEPELPSGQYDNQYEGYGRHRADDSRPNRGEQRPGQQGDHAPRPDQLPTARPAYPSEYQRPEPGAWPRPAQDEYSWQQQRLGFPERDPYASPSQEPYPQEAYRPPQQDYRPQAMERPSYDSPRRDYDERPDYDKPRPDYDQPRSDYDQRDVRRDLPDPRPAPDMCIAAARSAPACPPPALPVRSPRSPRRRPAPVSPPRG